jgi:hypothetical protein
MERQFGIQRPIAWLDRLEALVARELAPSGRKIGTALRISTIVKICPMNLGIFDRSRQCQEPEYLGKSERRERRLICLLEDGCFAEDAMQSGCNEGEDACKE